LHKSRSEQLVNRAAANPQAPVSDCSVNEAHRHVLRAVRITLTAEGLRLMAPLRFGQHALEVRTEEVTSKTRRAPRLMGSFLCPWWLGGQHYLGLDFEPGLLAFEGQAVACPPKNTSQTRSSSPSHSWECPLGAGCQSRRRMRNADKGFPINPSRHYC
jgi:hypothetical protein